MKVLDIIGIIFIIIANSALCFAAGYNLGYSQGEKKERQEILKRLNTVDSIHKQDSIYFLKGGKE